MRRRWRGALAVVVTAGPAWAGGLWFYEQSTPDVARHVKTRKSRPARHGARRIERQSECRRIGGAGECDSTSWAELGLV